MRSIPVVLVLASLILSAFASPPSPTYSASAPIDREILAQLQQQGRARVIVELKLSTRPEGELPSRAVTEQRTAIARLQDQVLAQLDQSAPGSLKRFKFIPALALEVDAAGVATLSSNPNVRAIQIDAVESASLAQSTGIIGAPAAWAAGYSGAGQAVAVLDTGVDRNHAFMAGRVISEACFSTNSASTTSLCPNGQNTQTGTGSGIHCSGIDGCEHGTHVAGTAAGRGVSFSGVAKDANIIGVQVFTRFNTAANCSPNPTPCVLTYTSDQISALEHVYSLRTSLTIAAVNMSLGGGNYTSNCDAQQGSRKAAIDNLRSAGIATIIASGNGGLNGAMGAPACISTAISVGSTTDTGTEAVSGFSNSASFLSLLAPGQLINSSVPGGGFANLQGTSMATPHVAGAWAVMRSKAPAASLASILTAFQATGVMVNDGRNNIIKPRIQLNTALAALQGPPVGTLKTYLPGVIRAGVVLPILNNGNFESGNTGWDEASTSFALLISSSGFTVTPRSGTWLAWLGGGDNETSDVSQAVTLPAGSPAFLHFYYDARSQDVCGFDDAYVLINSTQVWQRDLCTSTSTSAWTFQSVDLRAYAGQTVTIHLKATTDSSEPSNFFVDDVALQPSASRGP